MFVHTKYSINYGVKSPDAIIDWAIKVGQLPYLVIADINSSSAIISSLKYAENKDIKLVAAIDVRNDLEPCYILIAKNNRGFHEINEFLTPFLQQKEKFPPSPPFLANCKVVYPLSNQPLNLKHNEYIGITPEEVHRVPLLSHRSKEKLLAMPIMSFQNKREYNTHRLLRAIHLNILLSQLKDEQQASDNAKFYTLQALQACYKAHPFLLTQLFDLLENTNLHFAFNDQVVPQNLSTYTGSKEEDKSLIEQLCAKGKKRRYPHVDFTVDSPESAVINERIEREIEVITQKGYLAYFLITWDIIHYAKAQEYFHVGRGSGANSIVAYLLDITNVDPLDLDLYFERFINLHRKNPPDFDIDFSWTERDEVLRYIFKRFQNTALICTYNTYQYRSCIRELGKVFGLPKNEIDQLSRSNAQTPITDKLQRLVLKYSQYIAGLPSHLSIHAGGVLISEKPISWYSATFLPPKGFPTVQFSMFEAEDIGFYKFDILSQRGLGKIRECLDVIAYNQPTVELPNIHDLNFLKHDKKTLQLLKTGEAMGCFYVESPAMRMLMKKLKTKSYLELVAASSIIRPGVASSGMMHEYILRHKYPERRKDAHPLLLDLMPETYGIMVYQEDVIKVAHLFAGLSLDEADVLRRGMSGKYRSHEGLNAIQNKFFENCRKKGHPTSLVQSIWQQIESFAGYAFSKGHSASYAVESFQSLYLKAHFPLEYMVATINNFGGYYPTAFYLAEAKKLGATVEAPCILNSRWKTVIRGTTIYLGFQHVLGLNYKETMRLLSQRKLFKQQLSFDDLLDKLRPNLENILLLIRCFAFRKIATNRFDLKWKAHLFYKKVKVQQQAPTLFNTSRQAYQLPKVSETKEERYHEELNLYGFSLSSPFTLLAPSEELQNMLIAEQLPNYLNKRIQILGYLVTYKTVKTKLGDIMFFGTFQDKNDAIFDTTHFPAIGKRFPFIGRGIYEITGKVVNDFDYYSIEVETMHKRK